MFPPTAPAPLGCHSCSCQMKNELLWVAPGQRKRRLDPTFLSSTICNRSLMTRYLKSSWRTSGLPPDDILSWFRWRQGSGATSLFRNGHRGQKISLPCQRLLFLCTILAFEQVAGEDGPSYSAYLQPNDGFNREEDWIVVVMMSLLFSFSIALFASVIGYISTLDDSIMTRYQNDGTPIEADVTCTEFARGGGGLGNGGLYLGSNQAEFYTFVEYNQYMSGCYRIRIRKQVRARESDFRYPSKVVSALPVLEESKEKPAAPSIEIEIDPETLRRNEEIRASQELFWKRYRQEYRRLDLLVLPDFPKSGIPLRQVERSRSFRYRVCTFGLVACILMIAAFCMVEAASTILEQEDEKKRHAGWVIFWTFTSLTFLQVPMIHCLFHQTLLGALEEEYLESAEIAPVGNDDSSLSSGSDMYLSSGRHGTLSSNVSLNNEEKQKEAGPG